MNFSSLNENIKAEKRQASLREKVYNTHTQRTIWIWNCLQVNSKKSYPKRKMGKRLSRQFIKEIIGVNETK